MGDALGISSCQPPTRNQLTRVPPPTRAPYPVVPKWSLFVKASQLWDPFCPLGDSWDRNTGFEFTMHLVTTTTAQAKKTKTKQHKTRQNEPKTLLWGEGRLVRVGRAGRGAINPPKTKLTKKSLKK